MYFPFHLCVICSTAFALNLNRILFQTFLALDDVKIKASIILNWTQFTKHTSFKLRTYRWLHCWHAKHSRWYTLPFALITISKAGIVLLHAAHRPVVPNNLILPKPIVKPRNEYNTIVKWCWVLLQFPNTYMERKKNAKWITISLK